MKIRNLLTVVAMLSVLLFGIGTAHAVLGVNDAVPGQDIVFPIICQVGGGLDTLYAIAETFGGPPINGVSGPAVKAELTVFTNTSAGIYDTPVSWTAHDILSGSCSGLVAAMGGGAAALIVHQSVMSPGGAAATIDFYEGYVIVKQTASNNGVAFLDSDRFVSWIYLSDLSKGFASGFDGISSEDGVGVELGEDVDFAPVAAETFIPRYFILNKLPNTWNWWIVLAGRNDYFTSGFANTHRALSCNPICDEDENCSSIVVPIPLELNVLNVGDFLPPALLPVGFGTPGHPAAGFAICEIVESGSFLGVPLTIIGTEDVFNVAVNDFYSIYGWSYERAADSSATLSWDVIHEMHRLYCDFGPFTIGDTLPFDTDLGLGLFEFYVTGDTTAPCFNF